MSAAKIRAILLLISALFFFSASLYGATHTTVSNKKILVLYKERDPHHEGIVKFLTTFLEEAGYRFDTRDVEALLVEDPDMSPYTGIMTCYQTSQMIGGDRYPLWLVKQMEAGRRILIIGSYGAYQGLIRKDDGSFIEWNESTQTINTFFHPFGLEFYFAFTGDPQKLQITNADKRYAQFQAPVTVDDLRYYQLYKSVNPANRIYFGLQRTDMIDSASALNVITPFGGMILEGYAYYWDPIKQKNVLRVDLNSFMKEVFSATSPPVPEYVVKTHDELLKENALPEKPQPEQDWSQQAGEIPRYVLVPYKKSEALTINDTPFFNRAAVILEYLGCIPIYWAIEDGLPDDQMMSSVRGIVTWHTKPLMHRADDYGKWMTHQIKMGKQVVILQEYGAEFDLETQEPAPSHPQVFSDLGIQFIRQPEKREEYLPDVRILDQSLLNFEKELDPTGISYESTYTSINPENRVFLSFDDREYGTVDLGVIAPGGGICLDTAPFFFPAYDSDRITLVRKSLRGEIAPEIAEQATLGAWQLNPYRFFTETLKLDELPAPDITTLNGSRIFYAHIDGDALESVSLIDRAHLAGFFVYEQVLKEYDDIPTTVSVITKFIEKQGNRYNHPTLDLTRKIFRLPNIDIAVHAATHPFDWVGGDPYITNPGKYPYKLGYKPHDFVQEIWGAKLFADHNLAPPGKECRIVLWSGETNPDERALEVCRRAGMYNLNGGDPRYDDEYPSLAGLAPYSFPYGNLRQYLTSAQNDYIYSLFLTGDWGGQKKVLQHFEKTDSPHRIYPMNLYYHFYAGIKNESLDALHHVYRYIRSIDAASIFATQYCEIVDDFYNTKIGMDGNAYWVENEGFLRTIRFKNRVHVDMRKSVGVLGYSHSEGETYVHLDGSRRRTIFLSDRPPATPYLIQSTRYIDDSRFDGATLRFTCRGFGKTLLKFGGLAPSSPYSMSLKTPESETKQLTAFSDHEGVIAFRTNLPAPSETYEGVLTGGSP